VSIADEKRTLRQTVSIARDALDAGARDRGSEAIAARILALPGYRAAQVVLLTLPFRSEWNAALLAQHALLGGKIVAAPRVEPAARMLRPLRIRDLASDVEAGYRGIPEPRADCPPVTLESIEFVLTPGVAFDREGRRLGYGGGYYDRLLPLLPAAACRVGGAFEVQIVARVPAAPHDACVQYVVTERRTIECGQPSA
jgi:5-formyltetrahydrofolate cyclo-ligase